MSNVTNIVLQLDGFAERHVAQVNAWLHDHDHPPLLKVDGEWRGHKAFEVDVWIGAFNYLDPGAFVEMCCAVHWLADDRWASKAGVLVVCRQDDHGETAEVYVLGRNGSTLPQDCYLSSAR